MQKLRPTLGATAFIACAAWATLSAADGPKAADPVCAGELCGFEQTGAASFYAASLNGRPTATGEPYNHAALTAAHRDLPMGSLVEVTNIANGRVVLLRVNDRGPFVRGRVLDVSGAAADELDFRRAGVTQVRLRYLGESGV